MIAIRDSNINALTIGRGAPLDASERSAWPDWCAPNDVAVIGVECPVDAAFLAKAYDVAHKIRSGPPKVEIRAAGYGTVRVSLSWTGSSKTAGSGESIHPLQLL